MTAVRTLGRSCLRQKDEKLRFVTFLTDKFYDEQLSETGHEFYFWDHERKVDMEAVPPNFVPIRDMDLPIDYEVDAVLCQDYGMQYKIARKFADFWHLPLVMIFHWIKNLEQPIINGDINIYDSYEIQESWNYPGAVIVPGADDNFNTITVDKNSKILLCDIKGDEDIVLCREIVRGTPFTINSLGKHKYERLEQYKTARAVIQIKKYQFPTELLEAWKVGLPVISVGNSNLKSFYPDYNNVIYNTSTMIKSAILTLDSLNDRKVEVRSINDFCKDFNQAVGFIDSFIYTRN